MCGCILGWRSVTYHDLVTVTLNLTSDLVSRNWCISPIFFEIGIPNLVCKCILGCLSVTNHFWVTVTLTSDLVFMNYCVQSISPILFDVGIPNLGWWFLLGWRSGAYNFESFWHWLLASFLGFSCYIIAIFPQMCLVLDQFLWGHSSRVCDISCFQRFLWSGSLYLFNRELLILFHQSLKPFRSLVMLYSSLKLFVPARMTEIINQERVIKSFYFVNTKLRQVQSL